MELFSMTFCGISHLKLGGSNPNSVQMFLYTIPGYAFDACHSYTDVEAILRSHAFHYTMLPFPYSGSLDMANTTPFREDSYTCDM